jgi:hypothetical protein
METKRVRLTRSNLFSLVDYLVRDKEEDNTLGTRLLTWLEKKLFGSKFVEKRRSFYDSFDLDNTVVEIVDNFADSDNRAVNLDDVCKLGCPYIRECSESVYLTHRKIVGERLGMVFYLALYDLFNEANLRVYGILPTGETNPGGIMPTGEFRLDDVMDHRLLKQYYENKFPWLKDLKDKED